MLQGFLKQSTAVNITITAISTSDHIAGKTGLSAGLTIYATKAAGTPASISPTVTELDSTNTPGVYKLALTSGHTDTLGELQLHVTGSGMDPLDLKWQVSTYLPGEAATLQADQAVNTTKIGGTSQTARDIGASVLLAAAQKVDVDTIKTQTVTCAAGVTVLASVGTAATSTAQTGDGFARIGAAGAGLTALGDTRIAHLDADVSSRMATFSLPTNFSSLVIDSTGRVNAFLVGILTSVFTEGATGRIAAAFKQFFNIASPAATMDHGVLVDTATIAGALGAQAKTDAAAAVLDALLVNHVVSGSIGEAIGQLDGPIDDAVWLSLAAGYADPLTMGGLITTKLDAAISSRLATASYTAPDNTSITAIKAKTDNLPESIKKNTGYTAFPFSMVLAADHVTPATGLTITSTVSIDGGAFGATVNTATEVSQGLYVINLAAADTNGTFLVFSFASATADTTLVNVKTSA